MTPATDGWQLDIRPLEPTGSAELISAPPVYLIDIDMAVGHAKPLAFVVRDETGVGEDSAKCMAAFLSRLAPGHKERIELDAETLVIVDEGSMVDLASMSQLFERANGARIMIVGDTKQISAVGAGGPMAALASPSVLGTQRLQAIRRQAEGWQREASEAFSRGEHSVAFTAYDDHGCIRWINGRDAAIDQLVADWKTDVIANPTGRPGRPATWHSVGAPSQARRRAHAPGRNRLPPPPRRACSRTAAGRSRGEDEP